MYVRDIFISKWNKVQALTQYQGEGSNHELASLAITEAIQHSKFSSKQPIFLLFLDARSAFDNVVISYLIRQLYMDGVQGNTLLYLKNRLENRQTFLEYQKRFAGPITDSCGLEQGGVSSSDFYKLYNNPQLSFPQASKLGVDMSPSLVLSAIGQADDTALLSNSLSKLRHILGLVMNYCLKYNVTLSTSKTKLMMICPPRKSAIVNYNPISINEKEIGFVDQAEHVGVIRSVNGNMPSILARIAAFKKALGSLISFGLARSSRSNPVASLRILSSYATPVLMSGLASLALSSKEIAVIDQQYKRTLQNIMKISVSSPPALVYFTAGSLPGTAVLHLKQISLFGMICRLQDDPLHMYAQYVLLSASLHQQSWFIKLRDILLQYNLPHPLSLLRSPLSKESMKRLAKAKVIDFWESKLRLEASYLPSLSHFCPQFFSLTTPHRLWLSAGNNQYEVSKARIQLLFLSSQYPCGSRTKHWSPENRNGYCTFPQCMEKEIVENPEHLLLHCPSYEKARLNLISMCLKLKNPVSFSIVTKSLLTASPKSHLQLLLDCSSLPEVISAAQLFGETIYNDLFYVARSWCFTIHRERMKRLGRWNHQ